MASFDPPVTQGVPERIQEAERWRVLGEELRALSPELYERVFTMLVLGLGDNREKITESYFVT